MDRRTRKSKEAIFKAFTTLLKSKSFSAVTVGEIIELADVGRATFYAHFETKDYLLRELCRELFMHLFDTDKKNSLSHTHIFDCNENTPFFLHLFKHLKKDDNNILTLMLKEDTGLFLEYFKNSLSLVVEKNFGDLNLKKPQNVPIDFYINHVACSFLESAKWWAQKGLTLSPEEIYEYFIQSI